jgi:hypothetical protein
MIYHDVMADAFEQQFLGWLGSVVGVSARPHRGTNAQSWKFIHHGSEVEFVIVGQMKNTCEPPTADIDWLLRIEEREPTEFIDLVAGHFAPADRVRRRKSGGRIRVQFKSTELVCPFHVEAITPIQDSKRAWRPWCWFWKR